MATKYQGIAKGRAGGRLAGVRTLWAALLFFTLLAFTWQSFVTQTHRHWAERGVSLGLNIQAPGATKVQKPGQPPADTPDNCPICHEIAHGGAYLAPAPILLDTPAVLAAWFAATLLLALALGRQPHGWQSRAPPIRIQA